MSALPASLAHNEDRRVLAPSPRLVTGAASRRDTVAIAALAAVPLYVVLFWRLGEPTFWDPDEAHYAETSREMIASGDWLAPFYNDEPFFDKPTLFHMLQSAAMVLAGPTEFGARLVPALAALCLIVVTAWIGSVLASRDVGLVAGLLLAASPASSLSHATRFSILSSPRSCSRAQPALRPPL